MYYFSELTDLQQHIMKVSYFFSTYFLDYQLKRDIVKVVLVKTKRNVSPSPQHYS